MVFSTHNCSLGQGGTNSWFSCSQLSWCPSLHHHLTPQSVAEAQGGVCAGRTNSTIAAAAAWSPALQVSTASHVVSAVPVRPFILRLPDQRILTSPSATKGLWGGLGASSSSPYSSASSGGSRKTAAFALRGIGDTQGELDVTGTAAEVSRCGKGELWLNGKNRKYCP